MPDPARLKRHTAATMSFVERLQASVGIELSLTEVSGVSNATVRRGSTLGYRIHGHERLNRDTDWVSG
jgi:hypothetical protein